MNIVKLVNSLPFLPNFEQNVSNKHDMKSRQIGVGVSITMTKKGEKNIKKSPVQRQCG